MDQIKRINYNLIKDKFVGTKIELYNLSDIKILNFLHKFCNIDFLDIDEIRQTKEKVEKILKQCEFNNIKIICIDDEKYPKLLKNINKFPFVLYYKGNFDALLNKTKIAVIGTRNPTNYGILMSNHIGQKLAEKDVVVVSGLAVGCDANAHKGCIEANGVTVAIMPIGLDKIVPKENEDLANLILEKNGCLISEYPPGSRVFRSNYIDRNRIQSGLSEGIIIVETAIKGGTMHTARFAQKEDRNIGIFLKESDKSFNIGGQDILLNKKIEKKQSIISFEELIRFIEKCKSYKVEKSYQMDFLDDNYKEL
ncbi:MAG: DNA-processing protein DprA [Pleomorphochaeta sp.]